MNNELDKARKTASACSKSMFVVTPLPLTPSPLMGEGVRGCVLRLIGYYVNFKCAKSYPFRTRTAKQGDFFFANYLTVTGDLRKAPVFIVGSDNDAEDIKGDYVLVQGEFGAVFYMVDYCFKTGRIPVYAATKRVVQEHKNGDKITSKRVFEHTCFRRYQRFK